MIEELNFYTVDTVGKAAIIEDTYPELGLLKKTSNLCGWFNRPDMPENIFETLLYVEKVALGNVSAGFALRFWLCNGNGIKSFCFTFLKQNFCKNNTSLLTFIG